MNKKIRKIIEDEFNKTPNSYTLEDDDVLLEELQNDIENLHAELRMVYNDLGKLLSITKEEI